MTNSASTSSNPATVWVIFAVMVIVCVEVLASVALALHDVDPTRIISLFAITTGSVIPSLFAIIKIGTVENKVDEARINTNELLNGAMDARIKEAVHAVLETHGVPQLTDDAEPPHDDAA